MSGAHSFYFTSVLPVDSQCHRCVLLYATSLSMIGVCVFGRQTATSRTLHMINWLLAFAASDTVLCSCRLQIARNGHSRKFIVETARRGSLCVWAVLCEWAIVAHKHCADCWHNTTQRRWAVSTSSWNSFWQSSRSVNDELRQYYIPRNHQQK